MGEWSDYFEDFPEENSANYVESTFDPEGAERLRQQGAKVASNVVSDQRNLDAEIQRIVKLHKQPK